MIGAFIVVDFAFGGSHGAPIGEYTTGSNTYSFVSQPSLHPPIARADVVPNEDQLPQGYIFIANFYDLNKPPIVGQSGPLIFDNHLPPVWFKPVPEDVVAGNLSLQTYQGKPALSWWQGYRHQHRRDRHRRGRRRQPALPDGRDAEGRRAAGC